MSMTSAHASELCRITVVGPVGRVDLAVPMSATVASLLPAFARHVTAEGDDVLKGREKHDSWVLQRLGERPLDPDQTPETADLLEGEELYLRPAAAPMPELDFDDVADGMATAMGRQRDRWQPGFNRPFFLLLAGLAVATAAGVLLLDGPVIASVAGASVIAALLLTASVLAGRLLSDRTLATMSGLGGCLFAALAGAVGVGGGVGGAAGGLSPGPPAALVASGCAAGAAAVLLALGKVARDLIAMPVFATVALTGAVSVVGLALHLGAGLEPASLAGLVTFASLVSVIVAPTVAIRAAKVRGPQLPRTAEELQVDIEPEAAGRLLARAVTADGYLDVIVVSAALVSPGCFLLLLAGPGWAGPALVVLFSAALLLRARIFRGAWQRVSLTLAGLSGLVAMAVELARAASPPGRALVLLGLLGVTSALVLAALRVPSRRLLPIWGHVANLLEACSAFAVAPVLVQLLGGYAWARGLFG